MRLQIIPAAVYEPIKTGILSKFRADNTVEDLKV